MSKLLASVASFAAGTALGLILDRQRPRQRFRHLARDIERALHRGDFVMHYQPIVEMMGGRWIGFEALLRWHTQNGTLVAPDLFMPVALEAGLSEALTVHVIELVARDMLTLLQGRPELHVAINTPPQLLGRGSLINAAECCGLNKISDQVIIEITETGIVDEISREGIAAARLLGTRVAIDDFGTGLNGLAQLQDLEIDFIKIDKSFVRKIGSNSPGAKLVDAIVTIARDINAKTIAEGVETEHQANYLRTLGVEFGQGWLFSKPLPVRSIRAQLQA
jgi:c-di-GMP phosphodiesterase